MIDLAAHPEGTVIAVAAQPAAKRPGVLGERNGALRLAVVAPPDKGKANEALIDLLAEILGCNRAAIRLLTGPASRRKRFLVLGKAPDEVRGRLGSALPPTGADEPA